MGGMPVSDILYMKIGRNIEVDKQDIYLSDVAKLECVNKEVVNRVKEIGRASCRERVCEYV